MDNKVVINPDRLLWCMNEFGMDFDYLSREVRISKRTLNRIADGRAVLSIKQLERIADYFGRGLLFFIDPGKVDRNAIYSTQLQELINDGRC